MPVLTANNSIAFSTLGCPEWTAQEAVAKAAILGFQGIEWRGGPEGHVKVTMPPAARAELNRRMHDCGLAALAVTTYTSFVSEDSGVRQANVDDLRRHLDLAADLGAEFVRVFLGELQPGTRPAGVYDRIVACLNAALLHAKAVGVGLAIEPHDDFIRPSAVLPILSGLGDPSVGVVWDVGNSYAAGEAVSDSFKLLRKRLFYVQVKDSFGRWPQRRLALLGEGEVPLDEAFQLLLASGYEGPFSYEWERADDLALPPADVAFPLALRVLQALLARAQLANCS